MTALKLYLSPLAKTNLQDIRKHSLKAWGEDQTRRYLEDIKQALKRLRNKPSIGRKRDEVHPGYRSLLVGQHIIFYHVEGAQLQIIAIVHQMMDIAKIV